MRRSTAAMALTVALAIAFAVALTVPAVASEEEGYWSEYKEEFKHRPVAVILALPAIVSTAPFMLVGALVEKLTAKPKDDDGDE